MLGFMIITAMLSMFISNTGATAMIIPIAVAVLDEMASCLQRRHGVAILHKDDATKPRLFFIYSHFTPPATQWRNKVAVGPRASIPKGPPLPPKNSVGQILGHPQRWARVHCTPCTPYCYATAATPHNSTFVVSGGVNLLLSSFTERVLLIE